VTVQAGTFSLSRTSALEAAHSYYLDYYADMNGNGTCDAPPVDHVWRLKIDQVTAAVDISDKHRMGFNDSCASFAVQSTAPTVATTNFTAVGRIVLGDQVSVPGLSAGQPLAGGSVFLEGFPEQEVFTGADGNFHLALSLPAGSTLADELTDNIGHLVMWYTKRKPGQTSADWDTADVRVGATHDVALNAAIDLGDQKLNYTRSVKIHVANGDTGAAVTTCWIHSSAFQFNLITKGLGNGDYQIDYLPPGTYNFLFDCVGYKSVTQAIAVTAAADINSTQTVPDVKVSPK